MKSLSDNELHERLNKETGKLDWLELQRHFARGAVVKVDPALDLIDVAKKFVRDDKNAVQELLTAQRVGKATEDDAKQWHESNARFWAVVAAPWILVQEFKEN